MYSSERSCKFFFFICLVLTTGQWCRCDQVNDQSGNKSGGGGGDAATSLSFSDKTVNTNVFDVVNFKGKIVYIYGSMANDLANKAEPYKWVFFYVPLLIPVSQQSLLSGTTDWVQLTRFNKLKIRLTQGNDDLEQKIRDSLSTKVSESNAAYASSWTIKPLMIDSLTAYIMSENDVVPGIKPCKVVNPQRVEISLNFGIMSSVIEDKANEVVERIKHGDYQIQMSIQFAGFSKIAQNVVSYSFESIQDAVSNTLADGPSTPKYIMRSQKSSFVQQISSQIRETVFTENKNKPVELDRLRSLFTGMIESAFFRAQEVKVEIGQLANVWSADDLKPDLIESEVNKLFKYDQSETDKKRDGSKYFKLDKSHLSAGSNETTESSNQEVYAGVGTHGLNFNTGVKIGKSSGQKFTSNLHDQVKGTNKEEFSESEIKKMLEKNSVEVEWKGAKFVAKSIRVIKIADIVQNIRASLVSKQIEVEKQSGVMIKTVNHEMIVDSELESKFSPRLITTTSFRNVDVGVYSLNRNQGSESEKILYFVPLMQPARDEHSSDNNNHSWIRAVSANQIQIKLIQYSQQLQEEIRREVSRIEQVKGLKEVKPFVIDSLTAHIKDTDGGVEGIESCRLDRVDGNMITLRFKVTSSSLTAQEIVDKILSQEYYIEVSMWLRIPSGPKTSQVSSSPVIHVVNTDTPTISYESSPLFSSLQERVNSIEARLEETKSEVRGLPVSIESSPFINRLQEKLNSIEVRLEELNSTLNNVSNATEQLSDAQRKLTLPRNQIGSTIATGTTLQSIAILKQLGYLAAGRDSDIGIKIYSLQSKQLVRTIPTSLIIRDLKPFQEDKLIGACADGKINIWNVETGQLVTTLEGHSGQPITAIALNKNESLMLSGGWDKNVILWNMVKYTQIRTFCGHTDRVFTVVFNEAKNQVISGSEGETIRVWNMQDGSLIRTLTGHSDTVTKLVVDESTGLLYSASDDTTIKEWNLESGQCVKTFKAHTDSVNDLIMSQEGNWLASASDDKSIIIWDKQTGSIFRRLNHTEELFQLALNPLNGQLISISLDGNILFWN